MTKKEIQHRYYKKYSKEISKKNALYFKNNPNYIKEYKENVLKKRLEKSWQMAQTTFWNAHKERMLKK